MAKRLKVTDELKQQIAQLRYSGLSIMETADKLNISRYTIERYGPKGIKSTPSARNPWGGPRPSSNIEGKGSIPVPNVPRSSGAHRRRRPW